MAVEINETIRAAVIFSRGEVRPVWFDWNGRQVRIMNVAFSWQTREGRSVILHFSVTDGRALYELIYNRDTMEWKLKNAES